MQGWESACRGGSWFLGLLVFGLLVSCFLFGVLVSWFLGSWVGFLVSKFLSFKASKSLNVFERDWFHITQFPLNKNRFVQICNLQTYSRDLLDSF